MKAKTAAVIHMPGRPLPHSIDAERLLVATCVTYPECLESVRPIVSPEHIAFSPLRRVYIALLDEADGGDAPVEAGVLRRLRGDTDAMAELADLARFAGPETNAHAYAALVRDDADKRRLIEIAARAYGAAEPDQIFAELDELRAARMATYGAGWVVGSDLEPENIEFLWRDRFVAGRINIVAGMGDVGKDVFCCTAAACVTTGRDWPDGAPGCEPGIVGVISPEDEPADTIVPRLRAAGADMTRIRIWTGRKRPTPDELSGLKLLIVSPLINLMDGEKDMNREQDARGFLELWQANLKSQGCTVIGTAHLNKKSDAPVVQRILGASGIANFVRSNWTIQRDDEDKTVRLFMRLKANLSPDEVNGLKFTIRHVGPWSQSIVCCWCGTTDKTPDAVMNAAKEAPASGAGGWLRGFLREHGECEFRFIADAAASNGFGENAVRQAGTRDPKITKTRRGFPATTYWRLAE